MSLRRMSRNAAGFTMIETLIVLMMAGLVAVIATPFIQSTIRHERLRSSVREVYSIILAARMQAVKRNTRVIVWFNLAATPHEVISWAENQPFDFIQNANEPTLTRYEVPPYVHFRMAPVGLAVDSPSAVAFETYGGDATITDKLIYQGDGTLLNPECGDCVRPLYPTTYTAMVPRGSVNVNAPPNNRARGIYMSDNVTTGDVNDRNTFRISVDDFGQTGRATLLKWLPTPAGGNAGEYDYVPQPWSWSN